MGCDFDGVCGTVRKAPLNPDGVCPEITGTYQARLMGFTSKVIFRRRIIHQSFAYMHWGRVHGTMKGNKLKGVRLLNPAGGEIFPESISIERRDNTLHIINVSSAGLIDAMAFVDISPTHRVCDKGQAFFSFKTALSGEFGLPAGGLKGLLILSKMRREISYKRNIPTEPTWYIMAKIPEISTVPVFSGSRNFRMCRSKSCCRKDSRYRNDNDVIKRNKS
jgi:hypothetical protein